MDLVSGTILGPYEILAPLEPEAPGPYLAARDARTDQPVTLRVLPPDWVGEALARREQQALEAAALGDPHIQGFLEFGAHGDVPYGVTGPLEGESLRARLERGRLSRRAAGSLALQTARGLAAAHGGGLVHGGLGPARLWIAPGNRVRILDFGLAATEDPDLQGYLAPECLRGREPDARSDVFSFGALCFELFTGLPAFRRSSAAETRAALLAGPLPEPERPLAPGLRRLLDRCLDRAPGARFPDGAVLAAALEDLALGASRLGAPFAREHRRITAFWAAAGTCLALAAGAYGWRLRSPDLPQASFQLLHAPAGTLLSARFGADGRRVYFSLRVAGGPPEVFASDPGGIEPRALGLGDALLLDVSPADELALIRGPSPLGGDRYLGTLARTARDGAHPQGLREGVKEALFDGSGLTTLTEQGFQDRLEFPAGHLADAWDLAARAVSRLALSWDRTLLACVDEDLQSGATALTTYRRDGGHREVYRREGDGTGGALTGLAWGPGGDLWVSERDGDQTVLWALSPAGTQRVLWRSQGCLQLLDVSRQGRALLVQQTLRRTLCAVRGGVQADLPVQGGTQVRGMTADGRWILTNESPAPGGGTLRDRCFLRPLDGGAPRLLGKGWGVSLSADGRWAPLEPCPLPARELDPAWARLLDGATRAAGDAEPRSRAILVVPTGAGQPFALTIPPPFEPMGGPHYPLPGGRRVLSNLRIRGRSAWVLLDRGGAPPVQVSPEGDWRAPAGLDPLSPDGARCLLTQDGKAWSVQALAGGPPEPIRGLLPGERVLGWGADASEVFARSGDVRLPVTIARLDWRTGARRPVTAFSPRDPAGFQECREVFATPAGDAFVFCFEKRFSDLYLVDGLAGKGRP